MFTTLRARAQLMVGLFVVLLAGGAIATLLMARSQAKDGTVINVAGRQRMLIQRCAKAAIAASTGEPKAQQELEASARLFDDTLTALLNGGAVQLGGGKTTQVPPAKDEAARAHLQTVQRDWPRYHEALQQAAAGSSGAVTTVMEMSGPVLAEANAAVKRFEEVSAGKVGTVQGFQVALVVVGVLLGGWMLVGMRQALLLPLEQLADRAERAAVGQIDGEFTSAGNSELRRIETGFEHVSQTLTEVRAACKALEEGRFERIDEGAGAFTRDTVRPVMELLAAVVRESTELATAAKKGELERRADASRFPGAYGTMVHEMNDIFESIQAPIHQAQAVLTRVANNDLSKRIDARYEGQHNMIVDAVNQAVDRLEQTLRMVSRATLDMNSASSDIASGSQALAKDASLQAASIDRISVAVTEMSSMSKQNAGSTEDARTITTATIAAASKGRESMEALSNAMLEIKESSDETAKIVNTIDEIAFQTNLLALNAAVEAARAGDAGRGFAVVADEVRNLAMRSADAAKTTAQLIEQSAQRAQRGVDFKDRVLDGLQEIVDQVDQVSSVITQIATASNQQCESVGEVEQAVSNLSGLTQRNAATAEQSASAAEEMSQQSNALATLAKSFKFNAMDDGPMPAPTARPFAAAPSMLSATVASAASPVSREGVTGDDEVPRLSPEDLAPFEDASDSSVLESF